VTSVVRGAVDHDMVVGRRKGRNVAMEHGEGDLMSSIPLDSYRHLGWSVVREPAELPN
jgi:hypothetical protein